MDELEKRLKQDAERIRAKATPELQRRIDAAVSAAGDRAGAGERPRPAYPVWWISSLTGVAAALLIMLLISTEAPEAPATNDLQAEFDATPQADELQERWPAGNIPLLLENADLTGPLEQELADLQSDLEKARESVERDVRNTF